MNGNLDLVGIWLGRIFAILVLASVCALCIALVIWVWGKVL